MKRTRFKFLLEEKEGVLPPDLLYFLATHTQLADHRVWTAVEYLEYESFYCNLLLKSFPPPSVETYNNNDTNNNNNNNNTLTNEIGRWKPLLQFIAHRCQMNKSNLLPIEIFTFLARELVESCMALHQAGIIHGGIHPRLIHVQRQDLHSNSWYVKLGGRERGIFPRADKKDLEWIRYVVPDNSYEEDDNDDLEEDESVENEKQNQNNYFDYYIKNLNYDEGIEENISSDEEEEEEKNEEQEAEEGKTNQGNNEHKEESQEVNQQEGQSEQHQQQQPFNSSSNTSNTSNTSYISSSPSSSKSSLKRPFVVLNLDKSTKTSKSDVNNNTTNALNSIYNSLINRARISASISSSSSSSSSSNNNNKKVKCEEIGQVVSPSIIQNNKDDCGYWNTRAQFYYFNVYSAPEILTQHSQSCTQYTPAADLWSLGMILFHCLMNQCPLLSNNNNNNDNTIKENGKGIENNLLSPQNISEQIQNTFKPSSYSSRISSLNLLHILKENAKNNKINKFNESSDIPWPAHKLTSALDFLSQMLQIDPLQRTHAKDLLHHPFLNTFIVSNEQYSNDSPKSNSNNNSSYSPSSIVKNIIALSSAKVLSTASAKRTKTWLWCVPHLPLNIPKLIIKDTDINNVYHEICDCSLNSSTSTFLSRNTLATSFSPLFSSLRTRIPKEYSISSISWVRREIREKIQQFLLKYYESTLFQNRYWYIIFLNVFDRAVLLWASDLLRSRKFRFEKDNDRLYKYIACTTLWIIQNIQTARNREGIQEQDQKQKLFQEPWTVSDCAKQLNKLWPLTESLSQKKWIMWQRYIIELVGNQLFDWIHVPLVSNTILSSSSSSSSNLSSSSVKSVPKIPIDSLSPNFMFCQ